MQREFGSGDGEASKNLFTHTGMTEPVVHSSFRVLDALSRRLTEGILQPSGVTPRCSVLIVEDDRVTREALTRLLQMFGYDTCPVGSVAEGVAKLDGQSHAIVDLNLPDGVGTYILQRIRDEKRPMRVAVCTGTRDESLVTRARAFGAEKIFRKPLDLNALFDWLNKVG